jgi:hypothetical protein
LPSGQNKKLRLYGPWKGQNDSETRASSVEFEKSFNVEFEGNEARTRPGRVQFVAGGPSARVTAITELNGTIVAATYGTSPAIYSVTGASTWTQATNPPTVTPSDVWTSFSFWGTSLILTGGFGPNLVFDGSTLTSLVAVPGQDSATTSYLTALPPAKWSAVYHGRLFLVTAAGTVYFSEPDNSINVIPTDGSAPQGGANVWAAANNFDARASASDQAAGAAVFGDHLVLPTREALFVYDEYSLRRVPGAPGCVAPNSIAETPKGLCYLASDGVRLFTGNQSPLISEKIDETLREYLSRVNVSQAVGVHYADRQEYRLYVPTVGSSGNDLCLVWDYNENRWTVYGGMPPWLAADSRFQEMQVSAVASIYAGSDKRSLVTGDYSGGLWMEDRGISDNGKPIYSLLAFSRIGFGEDEGVRVWRDLRVEARATGAPIKAFLLPDGEDLVSGKGAQSSVLTAAATTFTTLLSGQTTWLSNANGAQRFPNAGYGPVSVWRSWHAPFGFISRTVQPVLVCDGKDANGVTRGGRMSVRGIELQWRPRRGGRDTQ